jgi:hypothetical protein
MATPHLAGTIALMLEKNPLLTSVEIDSIIENFGVVDLGAAGKDNNYGAGRIDAYDAVLAVAESGTRKGTFRIVQENPNISNPLNVSDITWTASWIKRVKPTGLTINMGEFEVVNVYVDSAGMAPGTYWDTLWIYSNDPDENPYPEPICLITTIIGIEETEKTTQVPVASGLCHICPNPFRQATEIKIQMQDVRNKTQDISLKIYDVSGRIVKVFNLASDLLLPASVISWDATDNKGRKLSAGIYFVQLENGDFKQVEKVILLR